MKTEQVVDAGPQMVWQGEGDRARQALREYRQLLNQHACVPDVPEAPGQAGKSGKAGKAARSEAAKPLKASDLPTEMRALLERYTKANAGVKLEIVGYIGAGGPHTAIGAGIPGELPSEDDLVILSWTETVASASRVEARSQVLVLRRVGRR